MRLFAIHKERGEMLILSAENGTEAVKDAGLDMATVHSVVAQLRAQGSTIDAETVIRGGIGPQAFEIRELSDVCLEFKLDETGSLSWMTSTWGLVRRFMKCTLSSMPPRTQPVINGQARCLPMKSVWHGGNLWPEQ